MAKRVIDIGVAASALMGLSVPIGIVAVIVRFTMGKPILFRQRRVGNRGRIFEMYKFRTMTGDTSDTPDGLPDEARLTSTGLFLRRTSLDELPELVNVLVGDMSLVGPRPLLPRYLDRYTPHQARRHEVLPGITGWAQVNGRNSLTWEEKFELDVWYVDNWSIVLDLKILWMTAVQVLKREGIHAAGHSTMPEFSGTVEGVDSK